MFLGWLKRKGLKGYIDIVDRYHVAGWAAYPGGVAPTLVVQIDGTTVGQVAAKYSRPDLAKFYGANTGLGFYYVFPKPVAAGATVVVSDKHGRSLANSPQTVPAAPRENQDVSDVSSNLSTPVPEEALIFLVNGHWNKREFASSREATVLSMIGLLSKAGLDYKQFKTVLDFGWAVAASWLAGNASYPRAPCFSD